jgi:hypothetical protein
MSPKLQNILLAALALGVLGIYASLALRSKHEEVATVSPSFVEPVGSEEAVAETVKKIPAISLSNGLHDKGQWRGKPVIADLNRDGHADLVASIRRWDSQTMGEGLYVWLGDGAGGWTTAIEGLRRDMGYGGARVADVNGDDSPDIAFSGHDVMPQVFLGDGLGSWTASSEGIAMDGPCADVALGDVDGDGVTELVALGQFSENGGMRVFRRAGQGWEQLAEVLDNQSFGAQVRLEDLDGDGKDEILAVTSEGPRVWKRRGEAFEPFSEGLPTPAIGGSDLGILAHDYDGDGTKELLVAGMISEGRLPMQGYRWDGQRWSPWGRGLPVDEALFDIEFGDVDGDGVAEIVGAGHEGVVVIEHLGGDAFERVARVDGTLSVVHLTTGDVNADGRDDVVCVFLGKGLRVLDIATALGGTV